MATSVFDGITYRIYLRERLGNPHQRTGRKLAAAQFLGCHSGYLTRVLKEDTHLSLEQADRFNQFIGHTESEARFFLLLVQRDRSATTTLRDHFTKQIDEIREQRTQLHQRLEEKRILSAEDESRYYSQWYISAIHVLLSISGFQTPERIATYLNLPKRQVTEALSFLVRVGLALQKGERFQIGPSYLYLGPDSPNLAKHHSNWRQQCVQSFSLGRPNEIHFSAVLTLSYADYDEYKERMRKRLEEDMEFFKASKEEGGFGICLDLFEIGSRIK